MGPGFTGNPSLGSRFNVEQPFHESAGVRGFNKFDKVLKYFLKTDLGYLNAVWLI
jgi:hypothetical protein